jgi:EAL domain-containing protein (putative c-di-GMP-specific phosphodiesterase class I)/sensor domain CHASE-containing protein
LASATTNEADLGDKAARAPVPERYQPFGKNPMRTFVLAIGLPAVALYAGSALVVLFALVMMAGGFDRLEEERGVTAMAAALESFLNGLSDAVADEGTWNEAHLNVVIHPDPAWMDSTWGYTARLGTTYNDVIVTDQAGIIQFGENNLGPIRGDIAARFPAAASMLKELDEAIVLSGDAAVVTHFASDTKSTAGLAAISIHKSTPGEMSVPRQERRILWIAKYITSSTLQEIALRYQMPIARMVNEVDPLDSSINIKDADGNIAGTVAWTPERPGDIAFRNSAVVVFMIYFGIGLLLLFGLGVLRRAMMRRARKIEAAFEERTQPARPAVGATAEATRRPAEEEAAYSAVEGVTASAFTVDYQPILDLRSETMIGVETLLRWTRADKSELLQEELSPRQCAAMMERAAIIALRHATGELAPLLGVTLSIAVAPEQIMNGVFLEKVVGTLGATNFQMRRLQLSVDATLLPEAERIAPSMAQLRSMGIMIALANFTLGERTTGYIRPGFADRICLAPHMVAGIDADPVRLKLIETTIETARSASFAITVPNVQRKEEAAKLLRLGCREFRGPLLAKPMPIAALTALILAPAKPQPVRQAS